MDCRMLSSKYLQSATGVTALGLLLVLCVVVCVFLVVYV